MFAAPPPTGASPPENAIVLRQAEKSFPGMAQPALSPLDVEIRGGGVTGLVGPDGAGKTTLIRMLAGLLKPSGGSVRVAGFDPVAQSRELHQLLGYMPQRFGLYEYLTVRENLDLYAALRNVEGEERQAAFARLLRFTGLAPFTGRLAGRLSGGMKQKLGLACTLLGKPDVLLLDEPGVGVDPISRRELWAMVRELAGGGMLVLWSTSYLDEAELCREVLLLNQGKLFYCGPPAELTKSMGGRIRLVSAPDDNKRGLLQRAVPLRGVSDGSIQGAFVRLALREGASSGEALAETARDLGIMESAFSDAEPRFEDAFIDLLGGGPSQQSALAGIFQGNGAPGNGLNGGSDAEPVIEAVDLTRNFGAFTATDRVNFQVRRGEIFGLLGPNGAGKSTTFKMMCGLLRPSSGKALVLGMDLQKQPGKARQRLGYMAQKFSLYGDLSVRQNLEFFSGVYGLRRALQMERVDEMIRTFNFEPFLDQSAELLPLGFKQRLALACALMHRPDILFLDEPTSGVDPLTRREFWLHINGMVERGVTVMVTTHFMDEAEYCDRIGLVYRGKLIAAGSPDALKAECRNADLPDPTMPTMEDAFVRLIERFDEAENGGSA